MARLDWMLAEAFPKKKPRPPRKKEAKPSYRTLGEGEERISLEELRRRDPRFRKYGNPVESTGKYHRVRIISPSKCGLFRIKTFSARRGIKGVVCCPKGKIRKGRCKVGMVTQSVLFDKKKYTASQAKSKAEKFKR